MFQSSEAAPSNAASPTPWRGLAARWHGAQVRWRGLRLGAGGGGLWAPGMRLLRDLRFRTKALLAAACFAIPLVCLVAMGTMTGYEQHEATRRRLASLHVMYELDGLAHSLGSVLRPALEAELGTGGAGLPAALAADQSRFQAFADRFAAQAPELGAQAALESVVQRRRTMMAQATDASRTSLPGQSGPRLESMASYGHELRLLRLQLARANPLRTDAPAPVQALNEVVTHSLPELRWRINRLLRIGAGLYDSGDRGMRADQLALQAAQTSPLREAVQSDLDYVGAHGFINAPFAQHALDAAQLFVGRAEALLRSSREAGAGSALDASVAHVDRDAYVAAGRAALAQTDLLEDEVLARLTDWSEAQARSHRARLVGLGLLLAGWSLACVYLLACIYRALAEGLQTLCTHLEAVGRGDLSPRPTVLARDELGRALTALGASTGHMAGLFGAVTQGVAAVSQAAREVAGGNAGLSGRTASVRGLIAGVSERAQGCSTSLDTCGDQVEQTAELILGMRADGQRSRKAMTGLRDGMARLQVKSREIGQVVGLVEAVAYQTKLLSINASVEAARAGPAGRGFSVVAQEVRALAVRSEEAARRINAILSASIEEIESGGILAERAGEAVRSTETRIESVDGLMREAVRLTRSGRSESQEVLAIALSLEESMAGNVRVVEQLADASASLREQGDSLKRSVQHFVLG